MRAPVRQRGFLLIAAVVIIVAAGVMALVIVTLVAGGSRAGTRHLQSTQAFFIAESGLERGIHRWKLDNTYAGEGAISFGGGTYTVTAFDTDASGAALPTGKKRLRSAGAIGAVPPAARTLELVASRHFFAEQFPDAGDFTAEWTIELLDPGEGTTGFDAANCPAATCASTLTGSGSMAARTNLAGPNDRLTGYRERALTTSIETDAGLSIDVEVGYQKTAGNSPRVSDISITLVDSADVETTVWSNADSTTAGWVLGTAIAVSLPAGTYDRIRLRFDLHERGNNQVSAYFDEIRIKPAGGGVVREAWREVFP